MTGLKITKVVWDDAALRRRMDKAAADAAEAGAEHLLEEANKTVPRDKSDLAESGFVSIDREGMAVVGYTSDYAVVQHEGNFRHQGSGRKKWLELASREAAGAVAGAMAEPVKRALK
jgi:hypothetical protein